VKRKCYFQPLRKFSFLILVALSCNAEIKFDKEKWSERYDIDFPSPYREQMLSDLLRNHKLVGLKYPQLIETLGSPNFSDSNSIGYTILPFFLTKSKSGKNNILAR